MRHNHTVRDGQYFEVLDGCKALVYKDGCAIAKDGGLAIVYRGGLAIVYRGGEALVHKGGFALVHEGGHADGPGEIVWTLAKEEHDESN